MFKLKVIITALFNTTGDPILKGKIEIRVAVCKYKLVDCSTAAYCQV